MSVLDKVVAAITPEPDDTERAEARARARENSVNGSEWLGRVIDQHEQLERAFVAVRQAPTADEQRMAQKRLAVLLTGHSIAEETVLYPAMALGDQKGHSTAAYTEQSAAKVQAAALEALEPLSHDYHAKLEHLRAAVSHHMFEEESKWFYELANSADSAFQMRLSQRFDEEFERYAGANGSRTGSVMPSTSSPRSTGSVGDISSRAGTH